MAVSEIIVDPPLEVQRGCYVLFWLKRTDRGRFAASHVAIGTVEHSTTLRGETVIYIQEWPFQYTPAARAFNEGRGAAQLRIGDALESAGPILIAWKAETEPGKQADAEIVFAEANEILCEVVWSVRGGIHPRLYMANPARCLRYEDPVSGNIFPFAGSCAGFVEHCFERAGLDIVDDEPPADKLPGLTVTELREVDFFALQPGKSVIARHLDDDRYQRVAARVLRAPQPWHLLLPGYQLTAFATAGIYPHRARSFDDAIFDEDGFGARASPVR